MPNYPHSTLFNFYNENIKHFYYSTKTQQGHNKVHRISIYFYITRYASLTKKKKQEQQPNRTHFLLVEVHLLNKVSIKHIILLFGDFIMNFIQIFGNAIPPLRHHLEVRLIRKRRNMEFPIMGNKKSATTTERKSNKYYKL